MKVLLKSASIIDPDAPLHGQTKDILIVNGVITKIEDQLDTADDILIVEREGLCVSPGWFDSSVCFGQPGYEERETIKHGLKTAAHSGFTGVAVNPETNPVTDTNAQITFLRSAVERSAVSLHPIGALTVKSEGKDLAELYDMSGAGAVAFGDYKKPIGNPNLLKIALQYAQNFGGLVMSFPQENALTGKGVVNEGEVAVTLGLKGIPALAEEMQVARDLFLLEYTGGSLHIPTISTARSVQLIREARAKGLDVSCSVAVHHLFLTDEELKGFDTRYKVSPPLRTDADREALLNGVKDGTITMVTSDHDPRDIEHKKLEFDYADFGSIGLETAFGALNTLLPLDDVIRALTSGRQRFGLESPRIATDKPANLTLFSAEETYTFTKDHILSTSKNSAFLGKALKGKVYGIINNQKVVLN